ncbi:MAG: hypothetical protein HGB12_15700 [Bacteroidetes bacterium]|nr:hypothetical protein [Bacteroidota bacterium]
MKLLKVAIIAIVLNAVLFMHGTYAQTTPTILIDGVAAMASNLSISPYWLHAGQTINTGNNVNSISVLQYNIAPATGGGNSLQFESVLSITSQQVVPANKAWKIESVAIDPSAATGTIGCGNTNYILKYDGTNAACSQIFDNGTKVGIGTISPGDKMDIEGNLIFHTDNSYDIGANGVTRPRTGYFATSILAPTINATTGFQINGVATTGQILTGNGSNFVASPFTLASPGTSGNVLTSDGTNWTSSAPNTSVLSTFGNGSDGDVTIGAGTTTLTRDMYYNNLVVSGTLVTDGYRIFVKNTISGTGTIKWGTPNVGANCVAINGVSSNGANGGEGGAQSGSGMLKNTAGTKGGDRAVQSVGNPGTAGGTFTPCIGSNGAVGGTGGNTTLAGAVGGTAGLSGGLYTKFGLMKFLTLTMLDQIASGAISLIIPQAASTGGGGGASSTTTGNKGGAGGGGGASGGTIMIVAKIFAGNFSIQNIGANGGSGFNGYSLGGGGGGGAGGNGGINIIIYQSKTWTGSHVLTGGTGGNFGSGVGGGTNGTVGATGATGSYYEINVNDLN